MKKILIITLFCLVLLSGCKKEEVKPNKTTEPEKKYLTKMEMNIKLTEYGEKIYKDEKYKIVEKKDGIYFLSLNIEVFSLYLKTRFFCVFVSAVKDSTLIP